MREHLRIEFFAFSSVAMVVEYSQIYSRVLRTDWWTILYKGLAWLSGQLVSDLLRTTA